MDMEHEKWTLETSIWDMNLPLHATNPLFRSGRETIGDIVKMHADDFIRCHNMGKRSAIKILTCLDKAGFRISDCSYEQYPNIDDYLDLFFPLPKPPSTFADIQLAKSIESSLQRIGITTLSQLLDKKRDDLITPKIIGEKTIDSIVSSLLKCNLTLKGDAIFTCSKCGQRYAASTEEAKISLCRVCFSKKERINSIHSIKVTMSGPAYGSFTRINSGFVLFANVNNNTDSLLKIKLLDYYIVSNGQQKSPESYYSGYTFDEECLMPSTTKCCGKIWNASLWAYGKVQIDDYAIITLKCNGDTHMFKFVFEGETWILDDYYLQ